MNSVVDKQLINLFEQNRDDAIVTACLQQITKSEEVRYRTSSKVLPLEQAIDIYSTRAQINKDLHSGNIKGYDKLIPALKTANVPGVRIHSLELLAKRYIAFTDEAVSHLFGLLDSPKKKAAWFNLETGYD